MNKYTAGFACVGLLVAALLGIHGTEPTVRATRTVSHSLAPLPRSFASPMASTTCDMTVVWENTARSVPGALNQECNCIGLPPLITGCGLHNDDCHNCPYGNWGVEIAGVSGTEDGNQFRGWNNVDGDGTLEWNSCTSGIAQSSGGVFDAAEYSISRTVSVEAGCEDLDSSSITETQVHTLLELDFFNHDFVNWLQFRSRMKLDCDFESCESMSAPFKIPISFGNTGSTALARATLQ